MKKLFLIFIFILSSCSPAIRTTVFKSYEAKPDSAEIKIYRYKMPVCDYEEIGIVNSRQRNKLISMEAVLESLIAEARKIVGDAIIGLEETNPIHNVGDYGIDRDPVLSGTIIRFIDKNCKK